MSVHRWYARFLACLGLLIALLCADGCGGGSSPESANNEVTGASAQFLKPHGDNSIVRFGHEGPASERHIVSLVVAKNLAARATAHFSTQCETLSIKIIKELVPPRPSNGGLRARCPGALEKDGQPLARTLKVRADTLESSIAALRVKGNRGYALYHGNDGKDYALPVEKEGSDWKVAALVTTEL